MNNTTGRDASALREAGLIRVRSELGRELLDAGASEAFCVADHQLAHVYVRRRERIAEVKRLLEAVPGVATVLDDEGKRQHGLDHPRSGELVALVGANAAALQAVARAREGVVLWQRFRPFSTLSARASSS